MSLFRDEVKGKDRWSDVKNAMINHGVYDNHFSALDIGCASGEVTQEIAKIVGRVNAFDREFKEIDACPVIENVRFFRCMLQTVIATSDLNVYDIIFYLGVHHKIEIMAEKRKILKTLYKTKATIVQRAPLSYCSEFTFDALEANRQIAFYPADEEQGVISITTPYSL